jgi:hypothetical protein
MGGVGKRIITKNVDVRNIFAGSHTESWWRCSYNASGSPIHYVFVITI